MSKFIFNYDQRSVKLCLFEFSHFGLFRLHGILSFKLETKFLIDMQKDLFKSCNRDSIADQAETL